MATCQKISSAHPPGYTSRNGATRLTTERVSLDTEKTRTVRGERGHCSDEIHEREKDRKPERRSYKVDVSPFTSDGGLWYALVLYALFASFRPRKA